MPRTHDYNHRASDLVLNVQYAQLEALALDDRQQSLVERYRQLSVQQELTRAELTHVDYIWKQALEDEKLAEGLGLIDELHPPCLSGVDLLSENIDLRVHLSEHVPSLAAQKLQQKKGSQQMYNADHLYMTLLCPDGSGMVQLDLQASDFVRINDEKVCTCCGAKLSKHQKVLPAGDRSPVRR